MNYQEARAFVETANVYGSVLGLENMRQLSKRLGYPQEQLDFVHIAGTNGKGSVGAFVQEILVEGLSKVGRYVSPTLFSYRERISINGKHISREAFARCMTQVEQVCKELVKEGLPHPTPFELETMCAFIYFKEENCDLVILECGLGGDTDATNVITKTKVAVLTSISMDHMQFLGNTLPEIATHKAGIIKSGCEVVTTLQSPEVMKVIEQKAKEQGAKKLTIGDVRQLSEGQVKVDEQGDLCGQSFTYQGEAYEISLLGIHQRENALLAILCIEALNRQGYHISREMMKKGLWKTLWLGRFSILHRKPYIILDGAHNEGAAISLKASLEQYFKGKSFVFLMGMFRDKDYKRVIELMVPLARHIITIETPNQERALPAMELAEEIKAYLQAKENLAVKEAHTKVEASESIEAAVKRAYDVTNSQDTVVVFGSLSFLKEAADAVELIFGK